MATANTARHPNAEQLQNEWLDRLADLVQRVENWAQELGWVTRRVEKQMEDSQIGRYEAPALLLQEQTVRLFLEPIARSAPGADGVVDLYRMPAYDDVASLWFQDGGWQFHYASPAATTARDGTSRPLSRESLQEILEEMKRNAG